MQFENNFETKRTELDLNIKAEHRDLNRKFDIVTDLK